MKKSELKTTELVCENGIYLCKAPSAVSEYYPIICDNGDNVNTQELVEVEIADKPVADDNKKQCSKKLKIRAKFTFARLVQACVDLDYEKTDETKARKTKKNEPIWR